MPILPTTSVRIPHRRPTTTGCSRWSSAVCGEYARKLSGGSAFPLVTGLVPVVCKSIANASKVRILHLPPRAERAPDLRKRRLGALSCGPAVIGSNELSMADGWKHGVSFDPSDSPTHVVSAALTSRRSGATSSWALLALAWTLRASTVRVRSRPASDQG